MRLRAAAPELLARLAEVVTDQPGPAAVAAALDDARTSGALVPDSDGVLIPALRLPSDQVPAPLVPWTERGFLPFRVKPVSRTPGELRALDVLAGVLRQLPELRCVPLWISAGHVLSLHLPDATDLGEALIRAAPGDRLAWHAACLRSLERFVERDSLLRQALDSASLAPPPRFPVLSRYRRARAELEGAIGGTDLPPALPELAGSGLTALFCDPKPANFLLPAREAVDEAVRVDLDLLYYDCPVALQIVLVFFAHPVAFHCDGSVTDQFENLLTVVRAAGQRFGIRPAEIDAMLLYHLLRNFTSAALGETSRDARKARALAPLLACAAQGLPGVGAAPATAARLRCWADRYPAHGDLEEFR